MAEWDEEKRQRVLRERGIDFLRVAKAMAGNDEHVLTVRSPRDGEERFVSLVPIEGKLFAVVWTLRDGEVRIITARRARNGEEKQYRALFDGRN